MLEYPVPKSVLLADFVCSAAVALGTVLEALNTLLDVLDPHLARLVGMAPVAGVAAVFVTGVADRALRVVVGIQYEQPVVVQGDGFPVLLTVALLAVAVDPVVQIVSRRLVASVATLLSGA